MAEEYDVVVIGGGGSGTAVARDSALRGFKTILFEKDDFGVGTSGRCYGLIHGGGQYVIDFPKITEEMCEESGIIQKSAPFFCFRVPSITVFFDQKLMDATFAYMMKYSEYRGLRNGSPVGTLTKEECLKLIPNLNPNIVGGIFGDEIGINVVRFPSLIAKSAKEHGADIRNHTEVIRLLMKGKKVYGVKVRDNITGKIYDVKSRLVISACGPWVDRVAKMAGVRVRLRPVEGIHIFLDRQVTRIGVAGNASIDGGSSSMYGHEGSTLIGLTATDYFGEPEDCRPDRRDVKVLLSGIEELVPDVRKAKVIRTITGLRPTLWKYGCSTRMVSREHELIDHEVRDNIKGFITLAGGKLTTARRMAEETVDLACKKLGRMVECKTRTDAYPGGEADIDTEKVAEEYGLLFHTVDRLKARQGCRTLDVLELAKDKPEYKSLIDTCEPVTEAEVRYVVREEFARTLVDVRRRTRLGAGPCQGFGCAYKAMCVLADELNLPPEGAHTLAQDFIAERWKGIHNVYWGKQASQQELKEAAYVNVGNYNNLPLTLKREYTGY